MRVYDYKPKRPSLKNNKFSLASLRRIFKKKDWKDYGTWGFRLAAGLLLFVAFLFIYYSFSLPNPNRLLGRDVPESTKIYARDGSLIYEIHGEVKRTLVTLDQINPDLQHATIAVEDKNFYTNYGFSITGYARSALVDIFTGKKSQGGSTITQQFVKNAVLTKDKSFTRKIKELILSIELEARFSKADILKLYLNEIPYGRNAYGIEAAAQTYFGKSAKDIDVAESAYLAALPQAPTYYGVHRDALEDRKNLILKLMKDQNYINDQQYQSAKDEKVAFKEIKTSIVAPHFSLYVEDYLASKYGEQTLEEGGLKVYTTLDPKLQQIAEDAITKNLDAYGKQKNVHNAALVAMDPKTGQILAMVGSKNYFGDAEPAGCAVKDCVFSPNVNVALTDQQPGSSFKPYMYVTAFGKDFKYSPANMLMDVVTNFGSNGSGGDYTPRNFNLSENGPVSIRKALAGSLNIPAVKMLSLIGVNNVVQTAHSVGITDSLDNCGLSLVLGGCDVKLIDHTAGYSVLAAGGTKHEKTAILKIVDQKGKTLEEYQDKSTQVLDPQAVYELVSIMTDNNARLFTFGSSATYLTLPDRPVAAKTGTTQDFRDGWTLGFTPSLVAGVWTGNNNNDPMKQDAVVTAGPIWKSFMQAALKDQPVETFQEPEGIQHISVDSVSGKLPTSFTPETKSEVFADYAVPTDYDNVHVGVKIDSATNQVADSLTPPERIIIQPFTVLHSEKPDNPAWENPVIAWALGAGYLYPPTNGQIVTPTTPPTNTGGGDVSIDITSPKDNALITKLPFTISVSAQSSADISRVDLSIDGEFIASQTQSPFSFSFNKKYPDGQHTLALHAVDKAGKTADTSVLVNFSLDNPGAILITNPSADQTLSFPANLSALSPTNLGNLSFYYQTGTTSKLIGTATSATQTDSGYEYSVIWKTAPKSGTYQIYAKTSTGSQSAKIKVTVP